MTLIDEFTLPESDRSPIWEWAGRHINLPEAYAISGQFSVLNSPWMIDVFKALQNPAIRTVSYIKGIQTGGSLIYDVWIPWILANDPGPVTLTMHTADVMERHMKTRLNPVMERCEPVLRMLPKPGPMRTTSEIYFGGFFFIANAANISDQQSQSIRYKINDEIWHPKWQGVFADAVGRVTKYEEQGLSKIFNVSQAGIEGDVADKCWKDGNRQEWGIDCPQCHKFHPLAFAVRGDDDEKRVIGGVTWDRRAKGDDGMWDVERAVASARFCCPHCGKDWPDTDRTRAEWRRLGRYERMRTDGIPSNVSFHVESLAMRPMEMLVKEWLEACNELERSGNDEYVVKFRQKREAKPWRMEKSAINLLRAADSSYAMSDFSDGRSVEKETMRAMTVDRQLNHFWCEIGAFTSEPAYRQLFFGRVDTIDQVRQLQERYRVPNYCVAEDRRGWPSLTDNDCARFGWRGMMGVVRKTWTMRNDDTGELENFPHSEPRMSNVGQTSVPFYEFSADHCKDILSSAIETAKPISWFWGRDVSKLYLDHLKAEEKQEVRPGVWRWKEVKQNANHGLDTSSMMVAIGVICGIIRFRLADESKT